MHAKRRRVIRSHLPIQLPKRDTRTVSQTFAEFVNFHDLLGELPNASSYQGNAMEIVKESFSPAAFSASWQPYGFREDSSVMLENTGDLT
jgi:hypothetical protein